MKRFYREAWVESDEAGHRVVLDGRPVRTPKARPLTLPTAALAAFVAAEWAAQDDTVRPATMRINRLATTAVDLMPDRREGAIEQMVAFAGTDLVCYRAPHPSELAAQQARHWDPACAWLETTHDIELQLVTGVMPEPQPERVLRAVRRLVEALDDWRLVGLHAVTTASGSVVLGLMAEAGAIDAEAVADAALVDELYERARWGDEAEALTRERRLRADLAAAERYLGALG